MSKHTKKGGDARLRAEKGENREEEQTEDKGLGGVRELEKIAAESGYITVVSIKLMKVA